MSFVSVVVGTAEYHAVEATQREQMNALVDLARRTYGRVEQPENVDVSETIVRPTNEQERRLERHES